VLGGKKKKKKIKKIKRVHGSGKLVEEMP